MSHKIGILFSSYGPYHIARLEALAASVQGSETSVVGLELSRSQEQYPWCINTDELNFPLVSIVQDQALENTNLFQLLRKLHQTLNQVNPSVLAIAGYFQPTMLFSLCWCLWNRKPAILLSETTEFDSERKWWREVLKSWLVKQFKASLVGGHPHKRYLTKLGVPGEAIFLGYDVVGIDVFHPEHLQHLSCPIPKPYFLAINRFVPKKNLAYLISAYATYRQTVGEAAWDLVICGDGPLRSQLERQIQDLELEATIHLPGFLQQQDLLPYFAHANVFVHSSVQEQWGLVVNEAMAAGLPVLVSNHCGCYEDLVKEGINGFGFDPHNQLQLTDLMVQLSSGSIDFKEMGQAAFDHIQNYSPQYFAQGFMQSVHYTHQS